MPADTKPRRIRPRKYVMVELTPSERAKLERLRDARGERATLAGVFRDLLAREHDLPIGRPAADHTTGPVASQEAK